MFKRKMSVAVYRSVAYLGVSTLLCAMLASTSYAQPKNSVAAGLDGVQHFGITVSNLERAYEFYTEVLGGKEIFRDGDFQGSEVHNALMQVDELKAIDLGINPRSVGIPNLKNGDQRLDVVFIQFRNAVIELLQYRDKDQKPWTEGTFAPPHQFTSPAFPTNMHVSFQVKEDIDFDKFIADLEKAAHARGMKNVKCNRTMAAKSDKERMALPAESNTFKITSGKSKGWSLAYCKGPEGEHLEFNQVKPPVKQLYDKAQQTYGE